MHSLNMARKEQLRECRRGEEEVLPWKLRPNGQLLSKLGRFLLGFFSETICHQVNNYSWRCSLEIASFRCLITDKQLQGLQEKQGVSWERLKVSATLFLSSRLLIKGIKLDLALDCCL